MTRRSWRKTPSSASSHTQGLQLNYNVASDVQVPGDNKEQDVKKDLQAFLKDNAKNPNIVIKGEDRRLRLA
ncbi:MAG: hypothetical protein IPG10_16105 [Flavobacteriales bacterium]|nr:hypothetical protein [Flavobacteriales bacterium]